MAVLSSNCSLRQISSCAHVAPKRQMNEWIDSAKVCSSNFPNITLHLYVCLQINICTWFLFSGAALPEMFFLTRWSVQVDPLFFNRDKSTLLWTQMYSGRKRESISPEMFMGSNFRAMAMHRHRNRGRVGQWILRFGWLLLRSGISREWL